MRKILLLLIFLGSAILTFSQDLVVSGQVKSADDGTILPGVNVIVKGTAVGTVTDSDGKYSLTVPAGSTTLVFSFIGLQTVEQAINGRKTIDVQLSSDAKQLSEIVVTGVGVATDKKMLGIAVESITGDKLPAAPTASIDQALVGKIAGAQIMSSSGNPGTPVSIQLRGINTLAGGTNPLIMVDGVEMKATSLNTLDLNNVERVEVAQGASSATIYGAQGANGVIQIFTKHGKPGPIKVEGSSRISFDNVLNVGNVHQPKMHSFATDANGDILDNNGGLLKQDALGLWGEPNWQSGPTAQNNKPYKDNTSYHDHVAQLFRAAKTTNYHASLSGGTDNSDYYVGFSKLKQESVVSGALDRYNFSVNVGFDITKKIKFRSITQVVYSDNSVNPYYINNAPISSAMYTYPFADMKFKDKDGNYTYKFGGAGANNSNPFYFQEYQNYRNKTLDLLPTLNLHYNINKIFQLDYKVGFDYSGSNFSRITANQQGNASSQANNYFVGESIEGGMTKLATNTHNINSLVTGIIKVDFAKDLGINLPIQSTTQLAFDWRKFSFNRDYQIFVGLPQYSPVTNVDGAQASSTSSSQYQDLFITYGYLLNQKFEFKDIAGVSGGFRSDYSSTYGDASKPFTFPRADGFLRISKIGFWQGLSSFLPEFKIRAAYGEAGTQPVFYKLDGSKDLAGGVPNHYARIITYTTGAVDNGAVIYPNSVRQNPGLKVENSSELDLGLDIGISPLKEGEWFNYITGSLSVWNRKGANVLWSSTAAPSAGSESIYNNYVWLSSKGVQFSLDFEVFNGDNLKWNLITNFGKSKTFIDKTSDGKNIPLTWGSAATYTLTPGQQIGTIYGYKALTSISQTDPTGTRYIAEADAGNYTMVNGRVVEKATKQVQFTPDKYYLGNTTPKFNMSFINEFSYKDFLTLNVQIDWYSGVKTYNQTKEWMYSEGLHGDFDKPVTIDGEKGNWTAYYKSFYDASESNGTKDYFLENSSFARLRNLTVGFDIAKFAQSTKIKSLKLTFTGRNLYTITKYTGFDPEASQNVSGGGTGSAAPQVATQRGLDYWSFPNFKSYQIGLNVTF
ncbi:MAG TPA: SusC/RagA family TonB-linked outer membrane protein [Cyclobacteriaceae bacterium]